MEPAGEVSELAGGAFSGSLNVYDRDSLTVATLQVDEWVYAIGRSGFAVVRYRLDDWLSARFDLGQAFGTDNAADALELLNHLRADALIWQCGACDAWIFTSNRPRIGRLRCSTCGDGDVDFRHADRHVGDG